MGHTNLDLRPHQERGLGWLRHGWKQHRTHLLQAPTGAGKTAIAAEIAYGCIKNGLKVWFMAPYTTLIEQTESAWISYGVPQAGIIWCDHERTDPYNPLQIVSTDTAIRRQLPDDVDVVIIDEAHLKRKKVLEWVKNGDFIAIGLTATPFATWLGNYYENFIKVCTVRQLIEEGYLSPFEVYAPQKPDMKGISSGAGEFGYDYSRTETSELMSDAKIVGNIVEHWLLHGENEPTIAFCVDIAHANCMANNFCNAGVNAEVITGDTPEEERQRIFRRFEDGIVKIICNVGVLVAGFDSDVRCIIYARPTRSEIRWLQCIGRGLRIAYGKTRCLIFDHSGTVHRLGMPDEIEYETLPTGKEKKLTPSEMKKREKSMEEKECPKCKYIKPAGIYECPKCGFKPRYGKDVEVDENQVLVKIKGKSVVYTKEQCQDFYSQLYWYYLRQIEKGKNWKEGWIANTYKKKFGRWPDQNFKKIPVHAKPETESWIKGMMIRMIKGRQKYGTN
ncbi:DEAD/DEAH box helicase [Vibrio parahaemolyticus]|uniref:DEAD/DEAH box helicase n=1 Tax=Vibrio parahaemolyticus TaxID=670 RepID=UPI00387AC114|nr:DEAD/DEAH box helicase [Vibrio parahaemolyticus]HCG6035077.1 DEAD/DEAH box helicase [Vibrio parahaemolyticus]